MRVGDYSVIVFTGTSKSSGCGRDNDTPLNCLATDLSEAISSLHISPVGVGEERTSKYPISSVERCKTANKGMEGCHLLLNCIQMCTVRIVFPPRNKTNKKGLVAQTLS